MSGVVVGDIVLIRRSALDPRSIQRGDENIEWTVVQLMSVDDELWARIEWTPLSGSRSKKGVWPVRMLRVDR